MIMELDNMYNVRTLYIYLSDPPDVLGLPALPRGDVLGLALPGNIRVHYRLTRISKLDS